MSLVAPRAGVCPPPSPSALTPKKRAPPMQQNETWRSHSYRCITVESRKNPDPSFFFCWYWLRGRARSGWGAAACPPCTTARPQPDIVESEYFGGHVTAAGSSLLD